MSRRRNLRSTTFFNPRQIIKEEPEEKKEEEYIENPIPKKYLQPRKPRHLKNIAKKETKQSTIEKIIDVEGFGADLKEENSKLVINDEMTKNQKEKLLKDISKHLSEFKIKKKNPVGRPKKI